MLTADLVHVRRRGDHLVVVSLTEVERPRALALAASALALVRAHLGLPRGTLLEAWNQVATAPTENRLAGALFKLTLDTCTFDENPTIDPIALRREVFARAASLRQSAVGDFARPPQAGGRESRQKKGMKGIQDPGDEGGQADKEHEGKHVARKRHCQREAFG